MYKIVIDSCGELPEELKQDGHYETVSLELEVDGCRIRDDSTFDQSDFLRRVRESLKGPKSSCPSPEQYMDAYEGEADHVYVVTLSGGLSGSYNSAVLGKNLYEEEHGDTKKIYVFNSKSASIGETIIGMKIQEFEEFFELIGDYAKVGYAHFNILSKQGHAQKSWYKNIGEESGTPLSEIIGTYKSFHPDDRDLILQFFEEVQKGNADKLSHKIRVFRENGECTWTHVNLFVRKYAPQDKVIELISINYDITDLKQIEEMLVNERDRAEASDRLKSAFLANMSHEIRTPLNAIVGFSSLLASAENVVEKELYNSLISHNNELLLNLINDIIDLSKIEAGYLELHQNWFNLTELLDECVAEYARLLPSGVELLTSYPEHDALVELDKLRIKQILNNFLSNALKNTIRGYVEVFYEIDKHCVRIGVKDTGRGIPQNMLEKIFERFEKVDSFAQGVGLGLSICKSIVDKMNGRIQVYSQLGLGTTFIAELPCHSILVNE